MPRFGPIATLLSAALLAAPALAQDKAPATPATPSTPDKPATQPEKPASSQEPAVKRAAKPPEYHGKPLLVGNPAPELAIEKWVKGEPVASFEKGKFYIIEFWATWCDPCKPIFPYLSALQKEFKDKLVIVGVASPGWRDTLPLVEESVKSMKDRIGFPIAWDKPVPTDDKSSEGKPVILGATNDAYMRAAQQDRIPRVFVIDDKGRLLWVGKPADLDFVIDDVMTGKWSARESGANIEKARTDLRKIMDDLGDDHKAALKSIEAFEVKYPRLSSRLAEPKYEALMKEGQYAAAFKVGETVTDHAINESNPDALNKIAWDIVNPEGSVSDPRPGLNLAMRAATAAVEITKEKDPAILDTLARCYWLKGDKPRAIELQKKAIATITRDEEGLRTQLQDTLKAYEGGSN